ncbi:MAG: ABC transporter ATP-binding protein [Chloroflexi bacterium]|nr:ABC transporter ATP-binding protein [Chloroflexota bacterium]
MTDDLAIRFEHVTKEYRIGRPRSITTAVSLMLDRARGRSRGAQRHAALRDVSFEVERGGSLGIVGRNGAGKTTILKLMSRVTWPTQGRVLIRGRLISLIELGAGFHPELTGRENIYLHAAILGLRRDEIARHFDEIVQFAGIEKFVDTPVKWYSSGMYARLGFSVAAFSEPDILLVDEVLAVGDTAFQRRALDKMTSFVREGRTVLLVSHDMGNIRGLCRGALWLDRGEVRAFGPTEEVVAQYVDEVHRQSANESASRDRTEMRGGSGEIRITRVDLLDAAGRPAGILYHGKPLRVRASYRAHVPTQDPVFRFAIASPIHGVVVAIADTQGARMPTRLDGSGVVECVFESLPLRPGTYTVQLSIVGSDLHELYDLYSVGNDFVVSAEGQTVQTGYTPGQNDLVCLPFQIEHHADQDHG